MYLFDFKIFILFYFLIFSYPVKISTALNNHLICT